MAKSKLGLVFLGFFGGGGGEGGGALHSRTHIWEFCCFALFPVRVFLLLRGCCHPVV